MITDIHGNLLDPIWMAEFRGFFWGEGYIGITSWGKSPHEFQRLLPRLQITSRSDDAAILEDIRSKLGGIYYQEFDGRTTSDNGKTYHSKPYSVWRATKAADIARVCSILELGVMPAKKKSQVVIMRQFLETVPSPGKKPTREQYILRERLWEELKQAHKYSG